MRHSVSSLAYLYLIVGLVIVHSRAYDVRVVLREYEMVRAINDTYLTRQTYEMIQSFGAC